MVYLWRAVEPLTKLLTLPPSIGNTFEPRIPSNDPFETLLVDRHGVSACNFDPLRWGFGVLPCGRTGLGFDFDPLPGVVIFELRGAFRLGVIVRIATVAHGANEAM